MMTLFFSPGACSLASHIGLEETGAPYELKPILLAKGQQRTADYLKINPRGKVPALSVDGKILVENTGISHTWRGNSRTKSCCRPILPRKGVVSAPCAGSPVSSIRRTSASIAPSVSPTAKWRTPRSRKTARSRFRANLQEIDSMIQANGWVMGKDFTVVDGYALVFYGWASRSGMPVTELKSYTAWRERMMQRPTVKKSVESEESVSTS